jgi:N-methylhydantoinase A/oxoprolinase/acetone carboxylase beta subunit
MLRVGIDVGGTFTDVILHTPSGPWRHAGLEERQGVSEHRR